MEPRYLGSYKLGCRLRSQTATLKFPKQSSFLYKVVTNCDHLRVKGKNERTDGSGSDGTNRAGNPFDSGEKVMMDGVWLNFMAWKPAF